MAILHYTASPVVGGVERVISQHAELFSAEGYPVTVIAGRGSPQALPPGVQMIKLDDIDSEDDRNLSIRAALARGEVPPWFDEMRRDIRDTLSEVLRGIDVLLVHNVMTLHLNLPLTAALHDLLDRGRAPRTAAWIHDASWADPSLAAELHEGWPWELLRRRRPDVAYVAVSSTRQGDVAAVYGCPPADIQVIPNAVDVPWWWQLSPESADLIRALGVLEGDLFILQPVRITAGKNIAYSLAVLRAIKDLGFDPRLVVTGPPDPHSPGADALLAGLQALRNRLGLDREATFLFEITGDGGQPPVVDDRMVRDLYQACDLVFLPSASEGFGLPIIEAGVLGRPVFCSDIAVFHELGGEDVRYFSTEDDPETVAEAMVAWARSAGPQGLRRRISRRYVADRVMTEHLGPLLARLTSSARLR